MAEIRKLSVALCTHNRAELLRGALQSLSEVEAPRRLDWNVLVILNACSDESADVVESFAARLPIRYLSEPKPGVSNARNRAVDNVDGDFVLWTDDDVRVSRNWLRTYEEAISRWPDADIFGGTVRLRFEEPAASWVETALPMIRPVFAAMPLDGVEAGQRIVYPELPFGANFAIRATVQKRHHFDPLLGRTPGPRIRNHEETQVIRAVMEEGAECRWVPASSVDHFIPRSRQTIRYIRAYYLGNGITVGEKTRPSSVRLAEFVDCSGRVALSEMRYRIARAFYTPQQWARYLRKAAFMRGIWVGRYGR